MFCVSIGIAFPAIHGAVAGIPPPRVHDEHSYLLAADTFAHGRLTNPAPAHPEFFEAPHVLVVPTYQSKYPPGQGLVLAVGQVVFGHPIWGVWLSCGLFAGCLCWMLQSWTSRAWALVITTLVAVTLGTATYWAQSYWGGMLAGSGGALVYGSARRLVRRASVGVSVALGLGLALLAGTRPVEGALATAPVLLYVGWRLVARNAAASRYRVLVAAAPAIFVFIMGAALIGIYNRSVTGSFSKLPYSVHERQYFHNGVFLFGRAWEPTREAPERLARFYRQESRGSLSGAELLQGAVLHALHRPARATSTTFGLTSISTVAESFRGAFAWLVLLPLVFGRQSMAALSIVLAAALAVEVVIWFSDPSYSPITKWPALAIGGLMLVAFLLNPGRWSRLLLACLVFTMTVQAFVWWWFSHYTAPLTAAVAAMLALSIRRAAVQRKVSLRRNAGRLVGAACAAYVAALGVSALVEPRSQPVEFDGYPDREAVVKQLEDTDGRDLVMVTYAPEYSLHSEWVCNGADLESAPIVFAHSFGAEKDAQLVRSLTGRTVWRLRVSKKGAHLEPFKP
jgi:hypothetical protein